MGIVSDIGNAISGGITAVEDLAKGDIGGAVSSGLGAAVNGFMATNPELGLVSEFSGLLGGLTGAGGQSSPGQAGGHPGLFGNLSNILGSALQDPMGALGGLAGSLGGLFNGGGAGKAGGSTGGGGSTGAGGLPNVADTQNSIQSQLKGSLDLQAQMAQFQIQFQELSSLFKMLKDCGETAARNMA